MEIEATLTLGLDTCGEFESHHCAFKVSDEEIDGIFERAWREGKSYGSGPKTLDDMKIYRHRSGGGVYFCDPNRHIYEALTA